MSSTSSFVSKSIGITRCSGNRVLGSGTAANIRSSTLLPQQGSVRNSSTLLQWNNLRPMAISNYNHNSRNTNNNNKPSTCASPSATGSSRYFSIFVTMNNSSISVINTIQKPSLVQSHTPKQIPPPQQMRCFASGDKKKDFYELLGVSKTADKSTIKKAYFKLAKKYHPDTNQGDDSAMEKFKEVTAAYEVLSDDKQRQMYDHYGHAGVDPNYQQQGGGSGNPFEQSFSFGDGSFHFSSSSSNSDIDAEDLLEMFFGGGGGKKSRKNRGPRRGSDLQMQVQLSFMEAVFGTKKEIPLRYQVMNRESGATQTKERTVTIDTPPGIDTGMNLRFQGQGAEGDPGAPAGNLLVQIVVEEDKYFMRDGFDVHTEVPISLTQAVLGGTVEVRTLTGEVEMKIPKGCQPDTKLMMRNKGIQQVQGSRKGNQIVHLKIQIPQEISPRQEALLREFDAETAKHNLGISGRIAHAAEAAFESLFGNKNKKNGSSDEDDMDVKKQAAQ